MVATAIDGALKEKYLARPIKRAMMKRSLDARKTFIDSPNDLQMAAGGKKKKKKKPPPPSKKKKKKSSGKKKKKKSSYKKVSFDAASSNWAKHLAKNC